jgi:predicted regulator of Ras-like GTPase activity (Roadblock/LC7/MglB family)
MSADEAKLPMPETGDTGEPQQPDAEAPQISDILRDILVDLHRSTTEIILSMITTDDGLAMITHGTVDNEDHAAALCAELTARCQQAADEFRTGKVNTVFTGGSDGTLFLLRVNDNVMLAMTARAEANLGLLMLEGERAARAIAAAL